MKVALINAVDGADKTQTGNGPHPRLGLLSIGSYLKQRFPKAYIRILDGQILTPEEIEAELMQIKPDFVGVALGHKYYDLVLRLARFSKRLGAKVVMGGHYATGFANEILSNRGINSGDYCVDAIIQQDGEEAFGKYVAGVNPVSINNLIYCRNNRIVKNEIKPFPLPDNFKIFNSGFLDLEEYFKRYQKKFPFSPYKRPILICSQKGCSWRSKTGGCIFCSLMQKDFRSKRPKEVWKEIDQLVDKYGVDYVWDTSDNFLGDKEWFGEFYREFKKRKHVPAFKIYARTNDLCVEKNVAMLKDMDVRQIFLGFEGNDDKTLANARKGSSVANNKKAVELLKKYKIFIGAFLVVGLPGETERTLSKTLKFAKKIFNASRDSVIIPRILVPLPNSVAFELLKSKLRRKYADRDDVNWPKATADWVDNFCNVSYDKVWPVELYLKTLWRARKNKFTY